MKNKNSNKLLLLWYSHPRIAIACILIAINLVVILLFSAILTLITDNSFLDELAYIFTYTMAADGIYDFVENGEHLACFILKIFLTVLQMIIFSGALIGFTTDILQNTFDKRLENKGKLHLKNHYVFLNWSTIGQNIIYDLSFLEGEKTIVILTDDERDDVINSIENIFIANNRKKKGLRIFVKKGNPTSSKHLADISLSEAKYVGILLSKTENDMDRAITTKDLVSFKLLLSILGEASRACIVVETESEYAKEKIEQLIDSTHPEANGRISIFSHNSVIGHVLGRAIINPAFSHVYHSVLSFDGVEFYAIPIMNIGEALETFNDCIPIINYDDDGEVDELGNKAPDQLYVLSDSYESLGKRDEKRSFVKEIPYEENISPEAFTVFILSDSDRSQFVISEINNSNRTFGTKIECRIYSYRDNLHLIMDEIVRTDGKCKILLLSSENDDTDAQDTDVFLSLLELKRNATIRDNVEIFVEIANLNNLAPIRNLGIASVILSNKIISLFMLQLMTHCGSRRFFKDILVTNEADDGSVDFDIARADNLLKYGDEREIHFDCYSELVQSFYAASGKSKMLLGKIPYNAGSDENVQFFCDGMDEKRDVVINRDDQLVYVTYSQNHKKYGE